MFDRAWHGLVPVFAFFLAIWIGARVLGTISGWFPVAVALCSGILLCAVRWSRAAFGLRGWW